MNDYPGYPQESQPKKTEKLQLAYRAWQEVSAESITEQ